MGGPPDGGGRRRGALIGGGDGGSGTGTMAALDPWDAGASIDEMPLLAVECAAARELPANMAIGASIGNRRREATFSGVGTALTPATGGANAATGSCESLAVDLAGTGAAPATNLTSLGSSTSNCGSAGSGPAPDTTGSAEILLPQRPRTICSPSVSTNSPLCRRIFFWVQ
jgi:hypothetical protein